MKPKSVLQTYIDYLYCNTPQPHSDKWFWEMQKCIEYRNFQKKQFLSLTVQAEETNEKVKIIANFI